MDYRSPFEIRQQLLEESRGPKPPPAPKTSSSGRGGSPAAGAGGKGSGAPNAAIPPPSSSSMDAPSGPLSTSLPDDPTALVREVPGAENLKALSAALEQAEAVQRYMENENLSLEESATYIMENGSSAQKMSFFDNVGDSLVDLPQKRISKVLAVLLDSMWAQDPELQCAAPESFMGLLGLLNHTTAGEVLDITHTMLTVKDPDVRIAWGKLALHLKGCLSLEQLEKRMIPLALSKSEHAEPQDQRELSCKILSGLCEFLPKAKVEQMILPRALALCQDTNVGVRQSMCQQLGSIARALGSDTAKAAVAPELFELLNDEERTVSRAAFSCLLDLVGFFGAAYRKERLYPIIKSYVSDLPSEVTSLLIFEYGRFLDKIKGDIDVEEDVLLFARFFEKAATQGDDESRRNCAFNFPAVAASLPLSVFPTHLSPCLDRLAADRSVPVRRCIAAGIHELIPLLHGRASEFLEKPFLTLLRDSDQGVRGCFFRNVYAVTDCFADQMKAGSARRAFFATVADVLVRQAQRCKQYWRDVHVIVLIMKRYLVCFAEATITDSFAPFLVDALRDGATAIKDDCAALIVLILMSISSPEVRVQLFSRMNNEFARGTSCYQRQSYLRFVRECCRSFSRRCVRERMMECCFELSRDPVPSVRAVLARTLPELSKGLRTTGPGAIEEEFNNMMERLLADGDETVSTLANESKAVVDRAERDRKAHPRKFEELEQEDQRREKAEQAMLDLAKESDKAERRAKLRDMLKNERDKEPSDVAGVSGATGGRKGTSPGTRDTPGSSAAGSVAGSPKRRRLVKPTLAHGLASAGGAGPPTSVALPRLNAKTGVSAVPTALLARKRF